MTAAESVIIMALGIVLGLSVALHYLGGRLDQQAEILKQIHTMNCTSQYEWKVTPIKLKEKKK